MDIVTYNRMAWNKQVEQGNEWTIPVSSEVITAARKGNWGILLTPSKAVPRGWFPSELRGVDVLCLASGGGQQGPVLAAVGASVTVFDNSPSQLARDEMVAERDDLQLKTVQGDMADLGCFDDKSFDLIFHPVSNVFVPEVRPVWREAYRVLRHGGVLLAGITNPALYLFDWDLADRKGILQVKYALPYSDLDSLSPESKQRYIDDEEPLEYSHTLEEQIGGQLDAGFVLTGFYEDTYGENSEELLDQYMPEFFATRALKP